jgi:hypothetical protein
MAHFVVRERRGELQLIGPLADQEDVERLVATTLDSHETYIVIEKPWKTSRVVLRRTDPEDAEPSA